jgi:hypothetical protein
MFSGWQAESHHKGILEIGCARHNENMRIQEWHKHVLEVYNIVTLINYTA